MRAAMALSAGLLSATIMTKAAEPPQGVRRHDSGWTVPADKAARTNPLAGRSDVQPGGARLFHERCSVCHGEDARGTSRGPDLTSADVQAQPDGALFWKISSGNTRSGMPTFSFLPQMQRWQLVLHLRAHAHGRGRS